MRHQDLGRWVVGNAFISLELFGNRSQQVRVATGGGHNASGRCSSPVPLHPSQQAEFAKIRVTDLQADDALPACFERQDPVCHGDGGRLADQLN